MRQRDIAVPAMTMALLLGCFQEKSPRQEAPAAASPGTVPAGTQYATRTNEDRAESVPELAAMLDGSPDPEVRREAIYAIADVGETDDAAIIGQSLTDPDSRVRKAAIEALTGIGGRSSADWLAIGLGDPDPRIRQSAVEALGVVGGDSAGFLLQQALADADPDVRAAAQQILDEPRSQRDLR